MVKKAQDRRNVRRSSPGKSPRGGKRAASPHPKSSRLRPPRLDIVDAVVLEVYGLVHDQGWLADRALEMALRRERRMWATERRLAAESLYGLLRMQGQLEFLLGGVEPGGAARGLDLATRYAAWLVRFAGATSAEASARLAVSAGALRGLDSGDQRIQAIESAHLRLAVSGSLPLWIVERFVEELGEEEALKLVQAMNQRAPLTVRANLLRGGREALRALLAGEGVGSEPTRLSPWGLTLDGHQNAFALESFQQGFFEIQDEGSQLIALASGARPGKVVVDACAGAGGKSLALAAEMHNKGTLWALDSDAGRLSEARRRATRAGVDNMRTRAISAGEEAGAEILDLKDQAAVVLVDAPCSGLGTLRRKPDARWRLKPGDPPRFAALQRELLARFALLVAKKGRLLYATCAMGRTENADVAEFVESELGLVPVPLADTLGKELAAALGAAGNRAELFPHRHGTDGFFFASFVRRD